MGEVFIRTKWPIRARAYLGFLSMKRLEVFLLPLDGMPVHHRVTLSSKFAGTNLYTWVTRGTMKVKRLAQEHNAVPWPGLEPGLLDPESSALTIRPPCPLGHRASQSRYRAVQNARLIMNYKVKTLYKWDSLYPTAFWVYR